MKKNMGLADRLIRTIIAIVFISLYYTGIVSGTLGIILIALSVIFLITSFISFCPLYLPLGLSTLRKKFNKKGGDRIFWKYSVINTQPTRLLPKISGTPFTNKTNLVSLSLLVFNGFSKL